MFTSFLSCSLIWDCVYFFSVLFFDVRLCLLLSCSLTGDYVYFYCVLFVNLRLCVWTQSCSLRLCLLPLSCLCFVCVVYSLCLVYVLCVWSTPSVLFMFCVCGLWKPFLGWKPKIALCLPFTAGSVRPVP